MFQGVSQCVPAMSLLLSEELKKIYRILTDEWPQVAIRLIMMKKNKI
jgi:hypothetical protein